MTSNMIPVSASSSGANTRKPSRDSRISLIRCGSIPRAILSSSHFLIEPLAPSNRWCASSLIGLLSRLPSAITTRSKNNRVSEFKRKTARSLPSSPRRKYSAENAARSSIGSDSQSRYRKMASVVSRCWPSTTWKALSVACFGRLRTSVPV
ncbi:hypothetical protein D3C72_1056730 [compost metagenome]